MTSPNTHRLAAIVRDIGYVSFGKYGQYVVTAVTLPLLARTLGTEGLGLLSIGMSAFFVGTLLVDLGIAQFLAAKIPTADVNQLRGDYVAIRLSILAALGAALTAGLVDNVEAHVHIILLGLFIGGFASTSEDWVLIGQGRFGASTAYQAAGRVAYLVLLLPALRRSPTASTALLCLLMSSALTVVLTWRASLRSFGRPSPPRNIRATLRMALPLFTSRLLVMSYGQGSAAIYSAVLNAATLGVFSAGDRLVRAVQSLLDPIGFAMLPRMANSAADEHFWRRTTAALLACTGVGLVAAATLWATAPPLVNLIFGSEFTQAIPLLRLEALLLPAAALSSFVTTAVLPVRGDTAGVLIGSVLGTCVAATTLFLTFHTHSVWTLVGGTVVCEFAVALWFIIRMRRLAREERTVRFAGVARA